MLGFVQGKILSKNEETQHCLVLVGGVGYEIIAHRAALSRLEVGTETRLWLHTHAREDALLLYGFESEAEKELFRLLLSVSGLGPKSTLALLGHHGTEQVVHLIRTKDETEIATAPGIGKKTAERIVLELRSKIDKWSWAKQLEQINVRSQRPASDTTREDLASALENLGYPSNQVRQTLDRLLGPHAPKQEFEKLLRSALKELANVSITSQSAGL